MQLHEKYARNQVCPQRTNPATGILYYFKHHRNQHKISHNNKSLKTANTAAKLSSIKNVKRCYFISSNAHGIFLICKVLSLYGQLGQKYFNNVFAIIFSASLILGPKTISICTKKFSSKSKKISLYGGSNSLSSTILISFC